MKLIRRNVKKTHLLSSVIMVCFALLFGIALVPIEVKGLSKEIGWMGLFSLADKGYILNRFSNVNARSYILFNCG